MDILRQHESSPPPIPDDLPPHVQALLERCLAKRPEERYQAPADLISDLEEAIADLRAEPLGPMARSEQAARRPLAVPSPAATTGETALLPAVPVSFTRRLAAHVAQTPKLVPPSNLPSQLTSFVGREREREQVRRLLSSSRVLTLSGPGGIGKTRLALQVGADVLESYLDGVWLVSLAPVMEPMQVPQAVAETLGVREAPGRRLLSALAEWLRSKWLLLILDNCEHVAGACAELVETLVQTCPHVTVLASSREPLAIPGEVLWRVAPLDPHSEAAQLFAERAAAAHPSFRMTNDLEPLVVEICRRLDGLPLAIELAASRVKVLSVEEIANWLGNRFRLLKSGTRIALPHQQTLQAAIEWSYDLLSEDEQALFRRLGVFASGFTLEAAEAVVPGDGEASEILDGLAALVDKSLLSHETGAGGDSWYVMLQTIREYALERLRAGGEEGTVSIRHLDYCARRAETAERALRCGDQLTWLARLDQEHDNLRAVLDWCADPASPVAGVRGLRLAAALGWYWYLRGHRNEGRRRLEKLLQRAQTADAAGVEAPAETRAVAQAVAAHLAVWGPDPASAVPLADQACRLARETGNPLAVAWTALYRAMVAPRQGAEEGTASLWQASLTLCRSVGERWGVALSLWGLGFLAFRRGDVPQAMRYLEECHALYRQLGDRWGIALVLGVLANIAELQEDYAAAEAHFEEQQALARELGHKGAMAGGLNRLAALSLRRGDVAQAKLRFEESLALFRAIGEPRSMAAPQRQLARLVARYDQDYARAEALLAESLRVWSEYESVLSPIRGLLGWVDVALLKGERDRAARLLAAVEVASKRSSRDFDAAARKQVQEDAAELRRRCEASGSVLPQTDEPLALRDAIAYALGDHYALGV